MRGKSRLSILSLLYCYDYDLSVILSREQCDVSFQFQREYVLLWNNNTSCRWQYISDITLLREDRLACNIRYLTLTLTPLRQIVTSSPKNNDDHMLRERLWSALVSTYLHRWSMTERCKITSTSRGWPPFISQFNQTSNIRIITRL